MGSTIDDEVLGRPNYPWPWAHAPAIIEAAGLAEIGVKGVFATKPIALSLAEADSMIEACRRNGVIFTAACHLNWYAPYTAARELIARGDIGRLRTMIGHGAHKQANVHCHTFALFRLFADASARWLIGHMDDDEAAAGDDDLSGSGLDRVR